MHTSVRKGPMASEYSETGAATEPEPDATATPASYDPRVYQPPHPDDRDGGGGKTTRSRSASARRRSRPTSA